MALLGHQLIERPNYKLAGALDPGIDPLLGLSGGLLNQHFRPFVV
jgi:hypothetical protein